MILDRLVSHKRRELARRRSAWPLARVREQAEAQKAVCDFVAALRGPTVQLIAEIKRASPSRGVFAPGLDAATVACLYAQNGAAAISVLTDEQFFRGSLDDLRAVAEALTSMSPSHGAGGKVRSIPILRKDFTLDPYHVYEARAAGADAVLLIAAILDDALLRGLLALAHELGMAALVEVHDEAELERALAAGARVIGINNRDLRTFQVDLETTRRLHTLIPTDTGIIVVSESGIKTRADVERLATYGVDAILVGEALVTAADIAAKVRELTGVKR